MNFSDETLPIPRSNLTEMVATYRQNRERLTELYALKDLINTESELGLEIDTRGARHGRTNSDLETSLRNLTLATWRRLVEKMEIRRVLSVKAAAEMDKQLETGEGFPEITEENVLAVMQGTIGRAGAYLEEAVREVYDFLRPHRYHSPLKTNEKNRWELGRKVIKEGWICRAYSAGHPYQPNTYRHAEFRALDNVFHVLAGRNVAPTYNGCLSDAINKAGPEGLAETEFFKIKCYRNGNLHLEFKRMDLVGKLNAIAGGMRLKGAE